MGARTDAARAEVLVRRGELATEVQRLEAAGRSAVDVPARVRRAPVKSAGIAAGTAFLVLGGPKRVFKRVRRAVRGPQAELPKSMLPDEIERTLRLMGTDGNEVRGTLEREFANYIVERTTVRREQSARNLVMTLATSFLRPISLRLGWRVAGQLASADPETFTSALEQIRRRASASSTSSAPGTVPEPVAPLEAAPPPETGKRR